MNEEYRRLEAQAIEVEARIAGRICAAGTASDTDGVRLEAELRLLHQQLEGLRQGMLLIRRAELRPMRRREQEAAAMLATEGFDVCANTLRRVTAGMGAMLNRLTQSGSVKVSGNVQDRCLVASTDGGRVRLRETRCGETMKGRKRFRPAWREPRLFMIYAVDEHGRLDPKFVPVIDGTLGSCDLLSRLLLPYLKSLQVKHAKKVLFVADRAAWIWRRIPSLIKSLRLAPDQAQQRIDFWRAVEYPGKIADSSKLEAAKKSHWLTIPKRRLKNGEIGSVVNSIEELTERRRTKDQTTWLNDFINHGITDRRMDYWLHENAETLIRLRAWIKAGRDEEIF